MEPKVIQTLLKNHPGKSKDIKTNCKPTWSFSHKYSYFKEEGSGNNWAYGYTVHGEENYKYIKTILTDLILKIWESTQTKGIIYVKSNLLNLLMN